jgi:hypothetical protein
MNAQTTNQRLYDEVMKKKAQTTNQRLYDEVMKKIDEATGGSNPFRNPDVFGPFPTESMCDCRKGWESMFKVELPNGECLYLKKACEHCTLVAEQAPVNDPQQLEAEPTAVFTEEGIEEHYKTQHFGVPITEKIVFTPHAPQPVSQLQRTVAERPCPDQNCTGTLSIKSVPNGHGALHHVSCSVCSYGQ